MFNLTPEKKNKNKLLKAKKKNQFSNKENKPHENIQLIFFLPQELHVEVIKSKKYESRQILLVPSSNHSRDK